MPFLAKGFESTNGANDFLPRYSANIPQEVSQFNYIFRSEKEIKDMLEAVVFAACTLQYEYIFY